MNKRQTRQAFFAIALALASAVASAQAVRPLGAAASTQNSGPAGVGIDIPTMNSTINNNFQTVTANINNVNTSIGAKVTNVENLAASGWNTANYAAGQAAAANQNLSDANNRIAALEARPVGGAGAVGSVVGGGSFLDGDIAYTGLCVVGMGQPMQGMPQRIWSHCYDSRSVRRLGWRRLLSPSVHTEESPALPGFFMGGRSA